MTQCEGWRRNGGAFTLGPVKWEQCAEEGIVTLEVTQGGEVSKLPACKKCWEECIERGIEILTVTPIK